MKKTARYRSAQTTSKASLSSRSIRYRVCYQFVTSVEMTLLITSRVWRKSTRRNQGQVPRHVERQPRRSQSVPLSQVSLHYPPLPPQTGILRTDVDVYSFSDAWRSGDYPSAFDYLHRYFDYTMQNRDRLFYHYALMNLAIVQSDFGCHKEAMATMLETISTARENKDNTCLNFCLNWFYHFGRAHPDLVQDLEANSMIGSGKEALAFLRAKAKETGMLVLRSSALLSEAKLNMANGESMDQESDVLEYRLPRGCCKVSLKTLHVNEWFNEGCLRSWSFGARLSPWIRFVRPS